MASRPRHLLGLPTAAIAAVAAVVLAGCGGPGNQGAQSGTTVHQNGIAYSVQYSRELNPETPDDRVYLGGLAASKSLEPPGTTLLGVFLQAQNDAATPRRAVPAPLLADAFGQSWQPLRLPAGDPYGYRGGTLQPGGQLPGPDSVAAEGATTGLALVYRVPTGVFLGDRPFTVQFGTSEQAASVQLDV